MAVAAVAGAVVAGRNDVRADQVEDGREYVRTSANRVIAVPAITPDAGHLNGGLIEHHMVRLISVGSGIVSRHRNVDRGIDRYRSMHHCSEEVAIATIAGAVVTGGDHARADRPERADVSAQCGIPIAAITTNSRDLGRGLIKIRNVR